MFLDLFFRYLSCGLLLLYESVCLIFFVEVLLAIFFFLNDFLIGFFEFLERKFKELGEGRGRIEENNLVYFFFIDILRCFYFLFIR